MLRRSAQDPDNYQGFDPQIVGRQHRFVLGKHSGKGGVRAVYAALVARWLMPRPTPLYRPANCPCREAVRIARTLLLMACRTDIPQNIRPSVRSAKIASVAHTVTDELELDDLESVRTSDFFEVAYDAAVVQVNRLHTSCSASTTISRVRRSRVSQLVSSIVSG